MLARITMNHKPTLLILILLLVAACSDQNEKDDSLEYSDQKNIDQELGDEQLTQELNQKLMNATKVIGLNQESNNKVRNKNELEKLSEEDRQALIDLTIQESAKDIEDQVNSFIEKKEENVRESVNNRQ